MNRGSREAWNASRSICIEDAIRRQRERAAAERAELAREGRIDPNCRYARWDIEHRCSNRDTPDLPLKPWSDCWSEVRAQLREQQDEEREAAQRNLAPLPPYVPPAGLPNYTWRQR